VGKIGIRVHALGAADGVVDVACRRALCRSTGDAAVRRRRRALGVANPTMIDVRLNVDALRAASTGCWSGAARHALVNTARARTERNARVAFRRAGAASLGFGQIRLAAVFRIRIAVGETRAAGPHRALPGGGARGGRIGIGARRTAGPAAAVAGVGRADAGGAAQFLGASAGWSLVGRGIDDRAAARSAVHRCVGRTSRSSAAAASARRATSASSGSARTSRAAACAAAAASTAAAASSRCAAARATSTAPAGSSLTAVSATTADSDVAATVRTPTRVGRDIADRAIAGGIAARRSAVFHRRSCIGKRWRSIGNLTSRRCADHTKDRDRPKRAKMKEHGRHPRVKSSGSVEPADSSLLPLGTQTAPLNIGWCLPDLQAGSGSARRSVRERSDRGSGFNYSSRLV
jgi:hypothetical protein